MPTGRSWWQLFRPESLGRGNDGPASRDQLESKGLGGLRTNDLLLAWRWRTRGGPRWHPDPAWRLEQERREAEKLERPARRVMEWDGVSEELLTLTYGGLPRDL